MYERETILRLVALIYDAALNPDSWPLFLEEFASTIGGHAVSLGDVDSAAPSISVSTSVRWDPAGWQEYQRYFGRLDPWGLAANRQRRFHPGVVGIGEEVVPRSDLVRTEFHNDYGWRYHIEGGIAGTILREGTAVAILGAFRLPNHTFGDDEIDLVRQLIPHLQRALQMHQRITRLEVEKEATADAFDRLSVALILTDPSGQVAMINAAADAIVRLRDGLRVARGTLVASSPHENARLQQLLAACSETTKGRGLQSGGPMTVSRPSGKRSLHLLVAPLRISNRFAPRGAAGAAIFISDPELQRPASDDLLRQFYGLTRAEARLALVLVGGVTFQEATQSLGITANTGRGYLKNIFSKTETHTQAQLVRLVLAIPDVPQPR